MSDAGRILVTGIGGVINDLVARRLRDAGHDVVGASGDRATGTVDGMPVTQVDFSDESGLPAALGGVSAVFLDAPGADARRVTTALRAAGVRSVVMLSDATAELPEELDTVRYRDAEAAVRSSGLAYTVLRPTEPAGNALRWAAQLRQGTVAAPYLDAYQEPVDERDVVDAAVAVLSEEGHEGRTYYLSGGQSLTRREFITILADVAGRPVQIVEESPDRWRTAAEAAGLPGPVAAARLARWRASVGRPGRTDATITAVTGATPRTFATWAADHRSEFI